jgi:outer membrane lipoprotein-sorting protein
MTASGDLPGPGDVLALLHGAHRSFRTVRLEARMWRHHERTRRAVARREEQGGGRSGMVLIALGSGPAAPPAEIEEEHVRLWFAWPDRLREESGESVLVQVGSTWWSYDPQIGARTNGEAPDHGHGIRLHGLLDPAVLIADHEFAVRGWTSQAGRRALRTEAVPRPRSIVLAHSARPYGELPVELLVDAERGVLLRRTDLVDGEPLALTEVTAIEFDEALPADTFAFASPDGTPVRDVREHFESMHRRVASPQEAAALVPFTLFAPRVRAGWICQHAAVHPADERTRRPASATLHFAGDRAESQLVARECAADGSELPATPDGSDWRIEHVAARDVRLWDPGEGQRGYPRIAVIERGGTQIQLMAHGVEDGALRSLAAGLVPIEPAGIGA